MLTYLRNSSDSQNLNQFLRITLKRNSYHGNYQSRFFVHNQKYFYAPNFSAGGTVLCTRLAARKYKYILMNSCGRRTRRARMRSDVRSSKYEYVLRRGQLCVWTKKTMLHTTAANRIATLVSPQNACSFCAPPPPYL